MPTPRALAPDVARGLMLLLIAVANSSWYLWGHPGGLISPHPTDGSGLDRVIRAVLTMTVDGRVYPLFAFLFGYGMVQFARSRTARGIAPVDIRRMLTRRHLGMLLIGFLHAVLLFGGDIVGAYGFIGLVLVFALFDSRNRTLKIVFWVFTGYAVANGIISMIMMLWLGGMNLDLSGYTEFALPNLMTGWSNYLVAMGMRAGLWLLSTPSILLSGLVPAAVILGWLFARRRVLEDPARFRGKLIALAVGGIALGWLTGLPGALAQLGRPIFDPTMSVGWVAMHYAGGMGAGIGYAALFALFVGSVRTRPNVVLRALAAVGKRSLSCYLLQSVLFAPLLAAWGLGLGARINTAQVVLVAVGVWFVSLVVAAILEARGVRGPAEVWLRKLTYLPPDKLTPPSPIEPRITSM